ncbi:unnamed protein product [Gongylonema pulchrum]|uniref:Uncharacterized protein n=1 Tax=Gongylonema pulchrum TaxID=637853 RepID=A0A183EG43_9BILA|nr:unnamed protein product [Gongylonema pulchrum]
MQDFHNNRSSSSDYANSTRTEAVSLLERRYPPPANSRGTARSSQCFSSTDDAAWSAPHPVVIQSPLQNCADQSQVF